MPQLRDFLDRFRPAGAPGGGRARRGTRRTTGRAGRRTAPVLALRDVLLLVADAGAVEIDRGNGDVTVPGEAARRLQRAGRAVLHPALLANRPDHGSLERAGRYDLLAGEAQLESYPAAAIHGSGAAALAGWIPADRLPEVTASVAGAGGALVRLPRPVGRGATLLHGEGARRSLTPLVQTYGTVPSADVDPTWLAWATYVLMFGMMIGDAGHGVLLIAVAAALGTNGLVNRGRKAMVGVRPRPRS